MQPSQLVQITTTTETREQAEQLGRQLVEQHLAACVQIAGPIRSIYRWKGKVEESTEWRVLIKTEQRLFSAISSFLRTHHPYELPQLVALPVIEALPDYAAWVHEQLDIATHPPDDAAEP